MSAETPPPSGPLITVVVLNYNGAHLLPACLDALAAQDMDAGTMQVWVVDNGSHDGSLELLRRRYPWVRPLANGHNGGYAGGNNVALRMITTPFVALLNNDTVPQPDWVSSLLAPFAAPGGERLAATTSKLVFLPHFIALRLRTAGFVPETADSRELGLQVFRARVEGRDVSQAMMGSAMYAAEGEGEGRFRWLRPEGDILLPIPDGVAAEGPLRVELRVAAETTKPFEISWDGGSASATVTPAQDDVEVLVDPPPPAVDVINGAGSMLFEDGYGADRGFHEIDLGQYDKPEEIFNFCGAAVCLRTSAGRAAGWFDDDFFIYYEDTDLSWRLQRMGWSVRYEPTALVRHVHSATTKEWSPFFTFHNDRNRLLMLTKNARPRLAIREVVRYPLTTASLALHALEQARHARRRPPVRPTLLRLRVLGSYLRLLPAMLARRRAVARQAVRSSRSLERWMAPR